MERRADELQGDHPLFYIRISLSVMLRYPCVRACARLSVGGTGGHLYIGLSSAAVALSLAFYGVV